MKQIRSDMRFFYFTDGEIIKAANKVKKGKKHKGKPKKDLRNSSAEEEIQVKNSLGKFFENESQNLNKLINDIQSGQYKISPYDAIIIPRKNKKPRPILVPKPQDRIIFTATLNRIKTDLFFIQNDYNVFGSAKHNELPRIKDILLQMNKYRKDYRYILKIDIIDFFPSIIKDKLIAKLSLIIKDEYSLSIIKDSLFNQLNYIGDANKHKDRFVKPTDKIGIPQGCAYSPLLANFYALEIDDYLKNEGLISFRYLDDLLVFTKDVKHSERVFNNIKRIGKNLNLNYHPLKSGSNKSYIASVNEPFEYLGVIVRKDGFYIPKEKIDVFINTFKNNFFNLTTIRNFSIQKVFNETELYVNGWATYYKAVCPQDFKEVSELINEKLLSYINKKEYKPYLDKYGMNKSRLLL